MTPQELKNSILQLAIQGKLVEQRPEEGTAEELYRQIQREKQALIKAGKIKKEKPLPEITEDEIPFDIPGSWKWCRVGTIFNLQAGKNITSSDIFEDSSPKHPYKCYGGNGLRGYVVNYNREGHFALIGRQGALCGNINLASGTFYATEHAVVVEHFNLSDVLWSAYFLQALNLNQYATATAQPGLAVANINNVLIPLPPFAEQKRIVAKIEELLPLTERYGKAWNRLEDFNRRFPADMQKSLLQLAIQGKLVEQRPVEGTGEELHRQIQKEKQALIKAGKIKKEKPLPEITDDEIPFDIPESWKWIRLQDIILSISAGKSLRCNEVIPEDQEPGIIKVSAVTWGTFREEESKTCISLSDWNEEYRICEGDFLISRANTKKLVGACVIVESIRKMLMLSDKILRISFASDVDSQYLLYAMRSDVARAQIESSATGTSDSMKDISQNNIREIILPLPPLAEQKRIVAKLEELLPLCDRLK